ncbi:MAG: hypothetical protein J2P24_01505, partial [Streptosporangiales bacterium]|nr:hypothetical protein [Streptosporangiales bacterium]
MTDDTEAVAETPPPPAWAEGSARPRFTSWYADAFRHRAAPLRAMVVPTLPVAVAGVLGTLVLQLTTDTQVVDGAPKPASFGPAWLAAAGVLLLAGLVALTVGAAAAGLSVAAVRTGETRTVRWAVTTSVRRLPALAAYAALVVLLLVVSLAAAVGMMLAHSPLWFAVAVAFVVLLVLTCLVSLTWPLVLVDGRGPFGAVARSWRGTRGVRFRSGLTVLVFAYAAPLGALALVRSVLGRVGDRLPVWPWQLVDDAVVGAVGTVAAVLVVSAHVGVLFSVRQPVPGDPYVTTSPLDPRRVATALADDGRPEWCRLPHTPVAVAVAVVVAVLLPGLLSAGLLWWNPAHAVSYAAAVVDEDPPGDTSVSFPQPDGSVTVAIGPYRRLRHCEGTRCTMVIPDEDGAPDPLDLQGAGVTTDGHGGMVYAGWRTDEGSRGGTPTPRLRLFGCRPGACTEDAFGSGRPAVLDRYRPAGEADRYSGENVLTAVARRGTGYVVAAVNAAERSPRVTLYRCADIRCASPTRADVGTVDLYSVRPADAGVLSLAIGPGGRPVASVADGHTGAVHLLVCSDASCGRSSWRTVVAPTMTSTSYETLRISGAAVAVLPDGRPVLAYREASSGTSVLAVCRDTACTSTTTRRLTGPGWA